jgi:hypothetical protein
MAIQIKRGGENLNPTTADSHTLEDGQLFYSKFNNQTYIGDNGKPISQLKPKISSWLEPGEGNGAIQSTHKYLAESYHGEDYSNEAKGSGSLALGGYGNKALGTRSVALQNQSKSLANTSFVIGQVNTAETTASGTFIGGNGNIGYIPYSFIFGTKNELKLSDGFSVTDCSANLISGDMNKLYDARTACIMGSNNTSGRLKELDKGIKAANHISGANNISYGSSIYTIGNHNKASGWYLDQIGYGNFAVSNSSNYFYNPNINEKPHIGNPTVDDTPLYYTHQFGNNLIVGRWHTTQIGEYNHTNMYNAIEFGVNVSEDLDKPEDNPIRSTPLSITRQGKALYGVPYQMYCENGEDVFEKDIRSSDFDQYELVTRGDVEQTDDYRTNYAYSEHPEKRFLYFNQQGAYNLHSAATSYTNTRINELDVNTFTHSEKEVTTVVSAVIQNNGKISVTKSPINAYTKTQVDTKIEDIDTRIDGLIKWDELTQTLYLTATEIIYNNN